MKELMNEFETIIKVYQYSIVVCLIALVLVVLFY